MSTTIYLVRHGWTSLNAEGRFRGRLNPPLDDRGFVQPGASEGESMPDAEARVLRALRVLGDQHDGSALAAVSHEIPIRLVIAAISDVDGPGFWDIPIATGSITMLRVEDGQLALAVEDRTEV